MPRGRMLNKKISYDEKVAQLSVEAIVFYTWCIAHLDVKGRIYGESHILKGLVVPYIKKLTSQTIRKCQQEMIDNDLVTLYGNKYKYMEFKGFAKNQSLREDREAESNIPSPTPDLLQSNSGAIPGKVNISKVNTSKGKDLTPEFWSYFLLKTRKAFKLSDDKRELIKKRLAEGYTLEQLKQAVDSFVADDWEGRAEHLDLIYCIGKQKGKPDNLEKWINKEPESEFDKKWRKK